MYHNILDNAILIGAYLQRWGIGVGRKAVTMH